MGTRGDEFWQRAQAAERRQDLHEALRLLIEAEAASFDADRCASARWECHMRLGDYESAWLESDAIERRGNPDPNRFWNGESLDGRDVLVRCLHGLGDTLQYIRFAPLLRGRTKSLTLEAQPSLKALLLRADIADSVITWGEAEPLWDRHIEVVELPRIFRVTLDSIPNEMPYLRVKSSAAVDVCPDKLRVGVVWASGSHNPARTIPLEQFSKLFDAPGVHFYSLQGGEERKQIGAWSAAIPSLYREPGDALPTAEAASSLDLIITVDTMMAHLAGALGRPVWTLLPFDCDWRWMHARDDSPWYPTMRLFRQHERANWNGVLDQVKRELTKRVRIYQANHHSRAIHAIVSAHPMAPEE